MTAALRKIDQAPFSQQLREATREDHDRANQSAFVTKILDGSARLSAYTALAVQHFHIYTALEEAARALADHPVVSRFLIDGLERVPALTTDLRFLLGPRWRELAIPRRTTVEYCDRITEVAQSWPGGFVAHHYTRYLGDVSGGQVVRSRLRTRYDVDGDGARFYDFSALGSPAAFRRRYRQLLDTAEWDAAERERIIAEARVAFQHNIAVLDDLDCVAGG
jgi:heme oxygenase